MLPKGIPYAPSALLSPSPHSVVYSSKFEDDILSRSLNIANTVGLMASAVTQNLVIRVFN